MVDSQEEVEVVDIDDIELVDEYFVPIYTKLGEMGVSPDRLPTTVQIVSHLMELVPEEYLDTWLEAYARAEAPLAKS